MTATIQQQPKDYRTYYTCIRLNKAEHETLNQYMTDNSISKKSVLIRQILMSQIAEDSDHGDGVDNDNDNCNHDDTTLTPWGDVCNDCHTVLDWE